MCVCVCTQIKEERKERTKDGSKYKDEAVKYE